MFKKKDKSVKIIINVVEGGRSMKNNKEKIVFLAENHLEQVFRKVEWNVRVLVKLYAFIIKGQLLFIRVLGK